jgi:Zn-dependent protease/CBS domain-containing protein
MNQRRSIDLVRIAGIQIAIDYSWLLIFTLVLVSLSAGYFPYRLPGQPVLHYWLVGLAGTLLFFASIVVHELSHSLVANRLGQQVKRISLFVFGGMAHLSGEPRSAKAELLIAGVGPLTSFGLALLFWLVMGVLAQVGAPELWTAGFGYLAIVNAALAVFNLLPGFPLDGGRILRAFLWMRTGDVHLATRRAADWGGGIAIGIMILGALQIFAGALIAGLWLILIGLFLRGAARASYYGMVVEQALGGARVRDLMIPESLRAVPGDLSLSRAIEDYFLRDGFGGFPVTENGRIVGLLSLGDVKRCAAEARAARRVRDCMRRTAPDIEIEADAPASDALRKMAEADSGRLLVSDRGRVIGMITHSGLTRFVQVKTELAPGS